MKRGLKASAACWRSAAPRRSRAFPDEEGTESREMQAQSDEVEVPEPSPMKRGLKGLCCSMNSHYWQCSRAFPDEEGTESCMKSTRLRRFCRVPEPSPMKRGLKGSRAES